MWFFLRHNWKQTENIILKLYTYIYIKTYNTKLSKPNRSFDNDRTFKNCFKNMGNIKSREDNFSNMNLITIFIMVYGYHRLTDLSIIANHTINIVY